MWVGLTAHSRRWCTVVYESQRNRPVLRFARTLRRRMFVKQQTMHGISAHRPGSVVSQTPHAWVVWWHGGVLARLSDRWGGVCACVLLCVCCSHCVLLVACCMSVVSAACARTHTLTARADHRYWHHTDQLGAHEVECSQGHQAWGPVAAVRCAHDRDMRRHRYMFLPASSRSSSWRGCSVAWWGLVVRVLN